MTVEQKPLSAVGRYTQRMRRQRLYYFGAIAAVVIGVVAFVLVAWSHGEITHVTLQTAATPAPSVAVQPTSATLTQAWRSGDRSAVGTPYWGGTVITYDTHSVRGRNAATGAVTWSYTRSNRTMCYVAQTGGVTMAVYRLNGNCDQMTALDSATGERKWTRTLDENAEPIFGQPSIQTTQYTIVFTTPSVIYAIDPNSGIDRWVFQQQGCTIHSAVLGSTGALISQTCDKPDCQGKKFCGPGPQLLLRDGSNSRNDSDAANPDRVIWNLLGNSTVPVSGDQVVSAYDPTAGTLQILDASKGTTKSTLTLQPRPASTDAIDSMTTARAELIHIGDTAYAVEPTGAKVFWSAATPVLPSVTTNTGNGQTPDLADSIVAVPSSGGITVLDGNTGTAKNTYSVPAPPAGSTVWPLGSGFVVAGSETVVYR